MWGQIIMIRKCWCWRYPMDWFSILLLFSGFSFVFLMYDSGGEDMFHLFYNILFTISDNIQIENLSSFSAPSNSWHPKANEWLHLGFRSIFCKLCGKSHKMFLNLVNQLITKDMPLRKICPKIIHLNKKKSEVKKI